LTRSARGQALPLLLALAFVACAPVGCGGGGVAPADSTGTVERGGTTGAEKSFEEFGAEARGSDRWAILRAERSYFMALALRHYAAACARLSSSVRHSVSELAGGSDVACRRALPALLEPHIYAAMRAQARARVEAARVEGDRAFVVFHAPGARLYQLPLLNEDGEWKVGLLTASVLAPSL
jgi:hypothetical protein